ncbi:hypothetical protein [Geothrix fuzhouensis]|uniref:hypothetical protein n=1 Tax=Geothrix fuzhouensis TaxID=2966451 RepID=UPI0021485B2A|nr:hypothetical protein [Geothrix fuzhouensis]
MMDERSEKLSIFIKEPARRILEPTINVLNSHFEILRISAGLRRLHEFTGHNHSSNLLFATLHKNCLNFYAAIRLNQRGLHGSSALFFRPVFESLYLAKYCAIIDDDTLLSRWSNGENINLTNHVLNKIKKPELPETRELLKAFHGYSHSGVFSQQASLDPNHEIEQIMVKFALISTLTMLSHHLINRHYITSKFKYYIQSYSEDDRFGQALFESRVYSSILRSYLSKIGRRLYREYASTWVVN